MLEVLAALHGAQPIDRGGRGGDAGEGGSARGAGLEVPEGGGRDAGPVEAEMGEDVGGPAMGEVGGGRAEVDHLGGGPALVVAVGGDRLGQVAAGAALGDAVLDGDDQPVPGGVGDQLGVGGADDA